MMKRFLPIIVALLIAAPCHADITTGLMGWWSFEEGSGSSVADLSGRGHTGTWTGTPAYTTGRVGSYAASFDGSTTYVVIPDDTDFDFDSTNEFTIAAWVYSTDDTIRRSAVGRAMSSLQWLWTIETPGVDNRIDIEYVVRNEVGQPSVRGQGTGLFDSGAWYHVVGVKNTDDEVDVYVNGVQGTTGYFSVQCLGPPENCPYVDQDLSGYDIAIGGRRADTADSIWPGYVDDVRIYNRALSSSDIAELYAEADADITTGLVGHWDFDEENGAAVLDSSTTGLDGEFIGTPYRAEGIDGSALYFAGTDVIRFPWDADTALGTKTTSVWIKAEDWYKRGETFFGFKGGDCSDSYRAPYTTNNASAYYTGALKASYENASDVVIRPAELLAPYDTMDIGKWDLYTTVYEDNGPGDATITLYKNGYEVGTPYTITDGFSTGNCALEVIGAQEDVQNVNYLRTFTGWMDDARLYNRALDATDVLALYNSYAYDPSSDSTAPTTPTGFSATTDSVATASQVNLAWTASTDAVGVVGYKIYRSTSELGTYIEIAFTGDTSFSDIKKTLTANTWNPQTTIASGTTYWYKVKAVDEAYNESGYSSADSATLDSAPSGTYTLTVVRAGSSYGTVTSSPAGISCGATCSYSFDKESTVHLQADYALAAPYAAFTGWYGDACTDSASATCAFNINDDITVYAYYTSDPPSDYKYIRTGATGDDSGDDWTNAYPSFAAAASAGYDRSKTYYVAGGTYSENVYIGASLSGSTWLVIKKATLSSHGTDTGWSAAYGTDVARIAGFVELNNGYIEVNGVTGTGESGHGIVIDDDVDSPRTASLFAVANTSNYYTHHVEIQGDGYLHEQSDCVYWVNTTYQKGFHLEDCYIHNCPRNGITIHDAVGTSYSDYGFLMEDTVLSETGGAGMLNVSQHGQGVQVSWGTDSAYLIFQRNLFRNTSGTGSIAYLGGGSNHSYSRIIDNVFLNTDISYYNSQSPGVLYWTVGTGGDNSLIANNTFVGFGSSGFTVENSLCVGLDDPYDYCTGSGTGIAATKPVISADTAPTNFVVRNNIWADNYFTGGHLGTFTLSNNTYWNNTGSVPSGETDQVSESSDPFVDKDNYDFHLVSDANSVDSAYDLSGVFDFDKDGNTRNTGSLFGIGAYFYTEGGSDTTAPTTIISTSDPQGISTDTVSIQANVTDAVGVAGAKIRIGAAPNASNGTACTADDGTFDETDEDVTCIITGHQIGANIDHVAGYDAAGNYGDDSITVNYSPVSTTAKFGQHMSFGAGPVKFE